jgi:hypothetical protein
LAGAVGHLEAIHPCDEGLLLPSESTAPLAGKGYARNAPRNTARAA